MSSTDNPLAPVWDGAAPLRSNVSARTTTDGPAFVSFYDLVVDGARRIRKRPGKGAAKGSAAGSAIMAIHEFERVDPTTGVTTYHILRGHSSGIDRWTGAAWSAQSLPSGVGGGNWVFSNFANRCFAVNATNAEVVFDGTSWREVGIDEPATAALYALSSPYQTGTVQATKGSTLIIGTGTTWVTGGAWNDLHIDINGVRYQIASVGSTTELTLAETFKENSASGLAYKVYTGLMSWDGIAPKYSWARYNPTTGHISNRAPLTEITEQNVVGRTPTLTIAGSGSNTNAYNAGYTKIKWFRTARDGNQLVMIDTESNNNNTGADIVFTELSTTYLDKHLTKFAAPLTTNRKPPTAGTSIVAWLNRLWLLRPSDPTNTPPDSPRVYFSTISGESPIGVAEECWPRLFSRSGIAQPRGMIVVGSGLNESLVIIANDGNYTLDGYDNTTFTDPYEIGARRAGGWQGGAVAVDGRLIQVFRDKRLIDVANGDIGFPVQDKLNALTTSAITSSRLAHFAFQNHNYLLLSAPNAASSTNNYTLAFDLDAGRINEWGFGFSAAATVHNTSTGALELWAGDSTGNVYALLQDATWRDGANDFAPYFTTQHLDFGRRIQLKHARLYVGPSGAEDLASWTLTVYRNEDTVGTAYTFGKANDLHQSAQGREIVVDFENPVFAEVFQAKVTFPTANQDLYVERFELVFGDEAQDVAERV